MPGREFDRRRRATRSPITDYGALRAIDPATGERKWEFRYPTPSLPGVMSTASGLVFAGDNDGNFMAFDATHRQEPVALPTGAPIWGAAADDLHARRPAVRLDPSGARWWRSRCQIDQMTR